MKRENVLWIVILCLIVALAALASSWRRGEAKNEDIPARRAGLLARAEAVLKASKTAGADPDALSKLVEKDAAGLKPLALFGAQLELFAFDIVSAGQDEAEVSLLFKCQAPAIKNYELWMSGFLDEANADRLSPEGKRWDDGSLVETWRIGERDSITGRATSEWKPGGFYFFKVRIRPVAAIPYLFTANFTRDGGRDILGTGFVRIGWHIAKP